MWPILRDLFVVYIAVAVVVGVISLLRGYARRALWVGLFWAYYLQKARLDGWRDTRIK